MSCILLGTEQINIIADFLEIQLNYGFNYTGIETKRELNMLFSDCLVNGEYKANLIFDKLYNENLKAFNCRYKEDTEQAAPYKESHKIKHRQNDTTWYIELYKRLQCYIYQLAEDTTINNIIFKELTELTNTLACAIISNLEEYKNISWI